MPVPVDRVTIVILAAKEGTSKTRYKASNRLCGKSSLNSDWHFYIKNFKTHLGTLANPQHAIPPRGLSQQRRGRPTTVDLPMQPELEQQSIFTLHCSNAWGSKDPASHLCCSSGNPIRNRFPPATSRRLTTHRHKHMSNQNGYTICAKACKMSFLPVSVLVSSLKLACTAKPHGSFIHLGGRINTLDTSQDSSTQEKVQNNLPSIDKNQTAVIAAFRLFLTLTRQKQQQTACCWKKTPLPKPLPFLSWRLP